MGGTGSKMQGREGDFSPSSSGCAFGISLNNNIRQLWAVAVILASTPASLVVVSRAFISL